jgi:hypothetical protein
VKRKPRREALVLDIGLTTEELALVQQMMQKCALTTPRNVVMSALWRNANHLGIDTPIDCFPSDMSISSSDDPSAR